ncbi:hypothetical protein ACIPJG_32025 [Streptomyces halstedii]|uniref:hypothetical protein n=1 Tax=Streptomyces halstedii TaxID=1944 RepID=UPI00381A5DAE
MAEISYPFNADSPTGGTKNVSQVEWQNMSRVWADDRIDFTLTETSYSSSALPFLAAISGANLVVQAGSAWVGGFYYKNSSALSKPAPTNSGSLPRIDRVVLRADMSKGSVNLEIKTGTPSANPVAPALERTPGGIWEMSLWLFNLAANNGARTLTDTRMYKGPGVVCATWNAPQVSDSLPPGNFVIDMDSNNNDTQWEAFNGRDGFVVSRHLGKSRSYTPNFLNLASSPAAADRVGRWRWIASNTFWFSINIANDNRDRTGSTTSLGLTLPQVAGKFNYQTLHGIVINSNRSAGAPNMMQITGRISRGTSNMYLYTPNWKNLAEGLDGFTTLPAGSRLEISGVVEANQFNE